MLSEQDIERIKHKNRDMTEYERNREWRACNPGRISVYNRRYYESVRDDISFINSQRVHCPFCNHQMNRSSLSRHKKCCKSNPDRILSPPNINGEREGNP